MAACFPTCSWARTALDSPCPLRFHTAVVVAVRQPGVDRYDGQGAVCARRRRVPIIAIGAGRDDAIRTVATAIVAEPDHDLVTACVEVARGPSGAHSAAARRSVADLIGPTEHLDVAVTRVPGGLGLALSTCIDDTTHCTALVERTRQGLSRFTRARAP